MSIVSDEAVALRRLDYSETSQVIVFFARTLGKVRAIGKGLKRSTKTRFAVGIDLLEVGTLSVSRRERAEGLATLTEWKQTRVHSGLREKLDRTYAALYAAEITSYLTEDWDPHPRLFDALVRTLDELSTANETLLSALVIFQRTLLDEVGSLPRFDACALCNRTSDLTHFSSFEGGMICRHCEPVQIEKREVSAPTLKTLAEGIIDAPMVGPFSLLNYHISHLMGREPALANKVVPPGRRRRLE